MFSSYLEDPRDCRFQGQDDDETIILLLRAHPITNLSWIIPAVVVFLLPFFLPQLALSLGFNLFLQLPQSYLSAFLIIDYLLVLVMVFEGFLYWYFNVNIVTNKKILAVDFNSILFKSVSLTPLANIEEPCSSMGGILASIFDFGNVVIQTAGPKEDISFHSVPHPDQVVDMIVDQIEGADHAPS